MKPITKLPGFKPYNVVSNAFVVPMAAGIAIIHPASNGGFHAEFYEGTGNSSGTHARTITEAIREVKRFSNDYHKKQARRGTIRALMRQLAEQL